MTEKLQSLIIDDERLARRELRSMLAAFAEIEIVGEAESVAQAANLIEAEQPDVVFLDIQLAGETGFDLLERVSGGFKTVFVTAFDNYAIRAFEVNALDYLLKPIDPERLKLAVEKLLIQEKPANDFRPLSFDDRLFLELGQGSIFLKINRISHVLSSGDYSEVFTVEEQKFLVEKPLREWEARLPENHFARIHRNCIVNLESVERVETWFNRSYQIYLQHCPEPFAVSRRYAAKLKSKFG